jgi:hypothetical protein
MTGGTAGKGSKHEYSNWGNVTSRSREPSGTRTSEVAYPSVCRSARGTYLGVRMLSLPGKRR